MYENRVMTSIFHYQSFPTSAAVLLTQGTDSPVYYNFTSLQRRSTASSHSVVHKNIILELERF